MSDTYSKTITLEFKGMIARVHFPDLTPEERTRRLNNIKKAAAALLKN